MNTTANIEMRSAVPVPPEVSLSSAQVRSSKKKTMDIVALWIFSIGLFLLPLIFFPRLPDGIEFGKNLFIGGVVLITLFLWLLTRLRTAELVLPRSYILLGGFGLVVVNFLAAFFSPAITVSMSGFVYDEGTVISTILMFLLMLLASLLFQNRSMVMKLYAGLIASFTLIFIFETVRFVFGTHVFNWGTFGDLSTTVFGKWNDLGLFAGFIAILSLIAIEMGGVPRKYKVISIVALLLSLFGLVVVNFSLAWLTLGAVAIVVFVYNLPYVPFARRDLGESKFPVVSFIVLLISLLFTLQGNQLGTVVSDVTKITPVEVRPAWGSTLNVVKGTWKEDLLLGEGPNRFMNQWLKLKPREVNDSVFWNTDFRFGMSLFTTSGVTAGLLGLLAWVVFFALLLYIGFRALFASIDPLSHFAIVSSFILSVYLWAITILYVPGIVLYALAFVMTGVFVALLTEKGLVRHWSLSFARNPRTGFVIVLILIVLLIGIASSGYSLVQKFFSLVYFEQSREAFNNGQNFDKAQITLTKAINLSPSDVYYRGMIDIELARLAQAVSQQGNTSADTLRTKFQGILGSAISAGQNATSYDSTNYANWLALARVYAAVTPLNIPGSYDSALKSYKEAERLSPKNPSIFLEEARLEALRNNLNEARTKVNQAINLKGNYTDALFFLAQIDVSTGNVTKAIDSVEKITQLDPNNTGLFFQLGLLKYNVRDYNGAIVAFERAIVLNTDYANAKYFLGLSYWNVGRKEEALKQFESVLALNQGNAEVTQIIKNLKAGKDPFANFNPPAQPPQARKRPPISE